MDDSDEAGFLEQRGETQVNYEQAIKDVKAKEKELSKRTEMLENMMAFLANIIPGVRAPEASTSTPLNLASANVPPSFELPTPPSNQPSTINLPANMTVASAAFNYPKSYIRDALDLVPKYDGHNIPILQFARACKRAKESIPSIDESTLVRMLRNKLSHHAYLAVEDETHHTVDKFLDTLKRTFGPGRSANYYRGQLSIAYKNPNEHILDYIGRIKDLRTAIIEGDQTNLNRTLNDLEVSSIDSFALDAFYEGLPREYRVELRAEGYDNFSDACTKVIMIHKRIEREEARYKTSRNFRDNSTPAYKPPHRDLPNNPNIPSTSNPNLPATVQDNFDKKICSYCKNFGHLIHECRKRQYREGNPQNNYPNNNRFTRGNFSNNYPANNNNFTSQNGASYSGNRPEVSAHGTDRGLGNARPIQTMESRQDPSMSSEPMREMYPSSSSNLQPSLDQSPSCSTPEHNLI